MDAKRQDGARKIDPHLTALEISDDDRIDVNQGLFQAAPRNRLSYVERILDAKGSTICEATVSRSFPRPTIFAAAAGRSMRFGSLLLKWLAGSLEEVVEPGPTAASAV